MSLFIAIATITYTELANSHGLKRYDVWDTIKAHNEMTDTVKINPHAITERDMALIVSYLSMEVQG